MTLENSIKKILSFCYEREKMRTKIISISGRKKSGKDTVAKYICDLLCHKRSLCRIYHYADEVKKFCVDYLGLRADLCWGSDEDKNTLTNIKWENFPTFYLMKHKYLDEHVEHGVCTIWQAEKKFYEKYGGFMTYRQVLQQAGTELFRSINPNIWVDKCFRQIENDNLDVAIIADVRFPNEVAASKKNNALELRLTRNPAGKEAYRLNAAGFKGEILINDDHISETALDPNNYDWNNFTHIIDNQNLDLETTLKQIEKIIYDNNVFSFKFV